MLPLRRNMVCNNCTDMRLSTKVPYFRSINIILYATSIVAHGRVQYNLKQPQWALLLLVSLTLARILATAHTHGAEHAVQNIYMWPRILVLVTDAVAHHMQFGGLLQVLWAGAILLFPPAQRDDLPAVCGVRAWKSHRGNIWSVAQLQ